MKGKSTRLPRKASQTRAEVARLKRREEALRKSEARLKEAQQLAYIGYWERDLVSDRITWSEETYRIFGMPTQERALNQAELQQLIHPDDRQLQSQALTKALRGLCHYDVEYRIVRPDGEVRFVHVRDEVTQDKSGRPIRVFGTVQDITGRKQAEAKLREHEELLRVLTENANDYIRVHDLEGRSVYGSPSVERLYGRQPTVLFECVHPDDLEACQRWWKQVVAGESRRLEWRARDFSGQWHWLETSASRLEYRGQPRILTVCRDVTERKRAEESLKASEAKFREFIQSSYDIILFADREGNILDINPRAEQLTGYPQSDLLKMNIFQHLIVQEDQPLMREVFKDLFEGRPRTYEERWKTREGKIIYLEGLSVARMSQKGEVLSTFCTLRDITERRLAEQAVRESQQLLQQVLATLPVGVVVTNQAGDIILANATAKHIWGDVIVSGRDRWAQTKGFWHDSGKRIAPADWASVRALTQGQTSLNELIDIETFDGQQKK
ncbi:MAG: PAS domain S-box protein, partial [Limisphaerales bacterium]